MTRLPRFKRSPEIPAFQLTDRDREILHHVHRHRFLRSDHLAALTTGSPQQMLRRLQRLYHHGYYFNKVGSDLMQMLTFGAYLSLIFGIALIILPTKSK